MLRPDKEEFKKILLSAEEIFSGESTEERLGRNSRLAYEFLCEFYEREPRMIPMCQHTDTIAIDEYAYDHHFYCQCKICTAKKTDIGVWMI